VIMQLVVVSLAVILALATAMPMDLFERFMADHKKVYASEEEKAYRFSVFQQTLKRIEELNEGEPFRPHGINLFADLTQEEFRSKYLMPKGSFANRHSRMAQAPVLKLNDNVEIPTTFNWYNNGSVVTPVKNQEQCGSCWAFSTTENIESVWAIAGNTLVSLSPQQIVDCDTTDDGCNGGNPPTAYEYVIKAGGLETEKEYPYTAADGTCVAKKSLEVAKISSYSWITKTKNETAMLVATYNVAPISICVDAITWQTYVKGIITKNCGTSLDHCVQIVGFGTTNNVDYWQVRNSWGTTWGESGFLQVERNKDLCGIAQEATTSQV